MISSYVGESEVSTALTPQVQITFLFCPACSFGFFNEPSDLIKPINRVAAAMHLLSKAWTGE
jgi:hypothetical protein